MAGAKAESRGVERLLPENKHLEHLQALRRRRKDERTDEKPMNTQTLLDKIKPHARPTWGPRLDELAAQAETNGWTAETLANEVNKGIGPNTGTGYVVKTIERLATSKMKTNETDDLITGPCQLGCDHGWFNVVEDGCTRALSCSSCKPDTYRRLKLANEARRNGANRDQIYHLMSQNTQRVPHTYPVTH